METPHVGKILVDRLTSLPENIEVGSEGQILCSTCHDIHQKNSKLLRATIPGLCGACHEDKLAIRGSVHDPGTSEWARKLGFVSRGSCVDCHPVHGPRQEGAIWKFIGGRDASAQLCETCHRTAAPGAAVETPHLEETLANYPENLPENLTVSRDRRILCTTCHDIHQNEQGLKLRTTRHDSDLCVACHLEFGGLFGTAHDLRTSAPDVRNIRGEIADESGPCGSCHLVHRASGGGRFWASGAMSKRDFGSTLCTCCHRRGQCGAARVPQYVPTFDSRGELSRTGAISCLTCHDPHTAPSSGDAKDDPSPHRRMFLRSAVHRGLCVDCHGIETLWRFLYYHKERRNPYPGRNLNPLVTSQ
jgi:predicted CXXCH cytochrome family protein